MKRLTTLLGCCAFFLLFSFSASSQQVIFTESFDNGDPFIAGIATTQYQLLAGNCPQRAYRIGPNLNSICPNSFPNSPAPAGNCMSTNEGNNEPATRDLYSRPNQALSAGNYTVSFSTAHRYTQNQFPFVGRIGIFSGATQVGTINVPFGTNWTGSNLK
jgi:hypothetical protein